MSVSNGTTSDGKISRGRGRAVRSSLLFMLSFTLLVLLAFAALASAMRAQADEAPEAPVGVTATTIPEDTATREETVTVEGTQGAGEPIDDQNEAPVPTDVPASTATSQPASPVPTEADNEPEEASNAPGTPNVPNTATAEATQYVDRWEVNALRDFAETVGWPPVVLVEANDRLSVRKEAPGRWWSASIRSFSFRAGAEAAFSAEQEDARLSGYQLTQDTFYTFPAYGAYRAEQNSTLAERRYRWLVKSWVLGIDVRDTGVSYADVLALARQLMAQAAQDGLPVPPGAVTVPTATPQTPAASTPEGCSARFSDVPDSMWAHSYITELACKGIVSGYSDGTFKPQYATTRAQLVKMVVLLEGVSLAAPTTPTFTDVSLSHPFFRYVETAVKDGLIGGYPDGSFRPDAPVSRAQVAKIVVKARGWDLQVPAVPATLCDVSASHWAYAYIQVAIAHGIFTGYGDGCFRPDDLATRAQLAKVLVLAHR
jgi:hypothetical protein